MRHKPLVIATMTAALAFTAGPAFALPGDRAIDSTGPTYRLDNDHLEPGCFEGERGLPQDLSDHIDIGLLDAGTIGEDLHVSVDNDADASVDQVLVADARGYKVYNTFDTGSRDDDPDIDPNQTGTGMNGFTAAGTTSTQDTIVCVSDHPDGPPQNEPYEQQAGGIVSAKNRPILTPKVTAFGVSAISNLKTYKIGFGYDATSGTRPRTSTATRPSRRSPTRTPCPARRTTATCRGSSRCSPAPTAITTPAVSTTSTRRLSSGACSACRSARRWPMTTSPSCSPRTGT